MILRPTCNIFCRGQKDCNIFCQNNSEVEDITVLELEGASSSTLTCHYEIILNSKVELTATSISALTLMDLLFFANNIVKKGETAAISKQAK